MCKAGRAPEAYQIAKTDFELSPSNIWVQREMGWALYYMLKIDVDNRKLQDFFAHIEEFSNLDELTMSADDMIFENILWKIAEILKYTPKENIEAATKMFSYIKKYTFKPSKGYSFLLRSYLAFETWNLLVDFFQWWNIDNLMPEDYHQFKLENGKKIMSLAEQTYIAYSKALLKLDDKQKIKDFLPKIENLMENYPEMMYPGWYCGKLMLAMGAGRDEALNIVIPFVRKKKTEFWVWQLLADIYKDSHDIYISCLLRAIHCNVQEIFIGKIRIKLAVAYLLRNDYSRAKYHIDQVTRCYMQQGWYLPKEIQNWVKESWIKDCVADSSDGIDYKKYTDCLLTRGTNESIAIVTYVDMQNKRAFLVYGEKQRTMVKFSNLPISVEEGFLLKLNWLPNSANNISIIDVNIVDSSVLDNVTYIKRIDGIIEKQENKEYAFIKGQGISCFITPKEVQKYGLNGDEYVSVLATMDYNKKREAWTWICVSIERKNNERIDI